MKSLLKYTGISLLVLILLAGMTSVALAFDSGDNPISIGHDMITWTGQGGLGNPNEFCPSPDTLPIGIDPYSYLHWILTTDGGEADFAELHLGGTGSGDYEGTATGGAFHFFTPYYDLDGLTAFADINIVSTGNGAWILTISHGCAGGYEELNISKTVETAYTRTHDWSIAKSVDPSELYLYIPGQGEDKPSSSETTWTIDVTYEGYVDSDWNVSGIITVANTGTLDAVITSLDDVLAGTAISIDCGSFVLGDTLAVGNTLTCTYDVDVADFVEGSNVVTVTTERDTYSATESIVWGDPTTEVNETVTIKDISDLFGEADLGTITAPDDASFTYSNTFDWDDYGDARCGDHTYDNTAQVIGDGDVVLDEATATLSIYVQCYIYETAFAKGGSAICFIPTFTNWGWTNPVGSGTSYTWDLWAGAGQCDTSKGMLVGTVTMTYSINGYVTVIYNVDSPYLLKETHVYAGETMFPEVKVGKKSVYTVAPGQYYNNNPLFGPIYVIAHAVVGIPDPSFGP